MKGWSEEGARPLTRLRCLLLPFGQGKGELCREAGQDEITTVKMGGKCLKGQHYLSREVLRLSLIHI